MAMTWNVQPYQFLSELRENYVTALQLTLFKGSKALAAEMETWMKQNAPWKDTEITVGRGADKKVLYPAGTARKSLRARVDIKFDKGQLRLAAQEKRKAIQQDKATLIAMNAKRAAKGQIPLSQVPRHKSAVKAFNVKGEKEVGYLVNIKIGYGDKPDRIPYALWLEIANNGRYNIIARTLDHFGPKMMQMVKRNSRLKQFSNIADYLERNPERTQEEKFAAHVADYNKWEDRPYIPWSPERQKNRLKRRARNKRAKQRNEQLGFNN